LKASRPSTFPEIRLMMVSFAYLPPHDAGMMMAARADLSRMKRNIKAGRAVSQSNAYRVYRSDKIIRVEFLDTEQPEGAQIKLRFVYELIPPFRHD
jgi:hypothetical protein